MAYRTVEESSLTGIADAIREAGGTEESLLFPDDFLTAISNMGGAGGTLTVTAPVQSVKKNLITFPSDTIPDGTTQKGITFTAGDGYYEFNGTATDDLWLRIHYIGTDAPFDLSTEYSLKGAPEGCSRDTFYLSATNGLGNWMYDTGSGVTFTFSEIKAGSARVEIAIIKGATLDHVIFKPKLEKVSGQGVTVTVSKDGKTMTRVAGVDGIAVFRGLQSGTWTVTITDGTQTASKTVEIATDCSVNIDFTLILYDNGDQCVDVTGGWVKRGVSDGISTIGNVTFDDRSITLSTKATSSGTGRANYVFCTTAIPIDVTDFDMIEINISAISSNGHISLYDIDTKWTPGYTSLAKLSLQSVSSGVYTLDISQIAGACYVGFMSYSDFGASGAITVSEVLLK